MLDTEVTLATYKDYLIFTLNFKQSRENLEQEMK